MSSNVLFMFYMFSLNHTLDLSNQILCKIVHSRISELLKEEASNYRRNGPVEL